MINKNNKRIFIFYVQKVTKYVSSLLPIFFFFSLSVTFCTGKKKISLHQESLLHTFCQVVLTAEPNGCSSSSPVRLRLWYGWTHWWSWTTGQAPQWAVSLFFVSSWGLFSRRLDKIDFLFKRLKRLVHYFLQATWESSLSSKGRSKVCYPVAEHLGENVGLDSWVSNGCDFHSQDFMSVWVSFLNMTVMVEKI